MPEASVRYSGQSKRFQDLTGLSFNHWTVLKQAPQRDGPRMRTYWECQCECGRIKEVNGYTLKAGKTKSCGCKVPECTAATHRTHGKTGTPEYKSWIKMKERCFVTTCKAYPDYGGRGITVCERWKDCFENFLEDMGRRPSKKYSIERKDNSRGYSPDNCVWATAKEQARNTRRNVHFEHGGRRMCIRQWEEELGYPPGLIAHRIYNGWSAERAVFTPVK